jgi:hypothetical protein
MDEPPNVLFYNLCLMHNLTDRSLQNLAEAAGVASRITDSMFLGTAVRRSDAEKVLAAFSASTGKHWSLDTVKVALMPTFAELHARHQFDLARLARSADVPRATIQRMLDGKPILQMDARLVLQEVAHLTGGHYMLETVDVPVLGEEGQHG